MTGQRGHWPSLVHEVGDATWAMVTWLLAHVAVMGVLAVVSGVVDTSNPWVIGHRIAPAVLVAVTGFLTWFVMHGWDELQVEKSSSTPPDPRDPVGHS